MCALIGWISLLNECVQLCYKLEQWSTVSCVYCISSSGALGRLLHCTLCNSYASFMLKQPSAASSFLASSALQHLPPPPTPLNHYLYSLSLSVQHFNFLKEDRERHAPHNRSPAPVSRRPEGMPALDLQTSQDDEHAFRVIKHFVNLFF